MTKKEKQEAKNNAQNLLQSITDPINNPADNREKDMIPIDSLIPYANHPFKLYEGDRFSDMVRSIKEMGILLPIIVRPIDINDGYYEILSGHNRVNAAKAAELSEVPAIIKSGLSEDEAKLIVTETNLVQRSFADLTHSEKAVALRTHMDAIKSQGKRSDLINEINELLDAGNAYENDTSRQVGAKSRSDEKTGEKYGLSPRNVVRYIRLTYLNDSLQSRVNSDEISFVPAVSLSYLTSDEQEELNRILGENKYKVDMRKADMLRELSEHKKLTSDKIMQILSGEFNKKSKTKSPVTFKIKYKIYAKYFDEAMAQDEVESIIDKALDAYFKNSK